MSSPDSNTPASSSGSQQKDLDTNNPPKTQYELHAMVSDLISAKKEMEHTERPEEHDAQLAKKSGGKWYHTTVDRGAKNRDEKTDGK